MKYKCVAPECSVNWEHVYSDVNVCLCSAASSESGSQCEIVNPVSSSYEMIHQVSLCSLFTSELKYDGKKNTQNFQFFF